MEPVRKLVKEHPAGVGLVVAGRAHFFDNPSERHSALGLSDRVIELSLTEFTDQQINTYLQRIGLSGSVPSWLPSRPLLVGYLAAKGLLQELHDSNLTNSLSPEAGWNTLLDSVSRREAEIEAGIDGNTVRRILERLATKTRTSQEGLGSLDMDAIIQAFQEICGYKPDDQALIILRRLPGLGVSDGEEHSRSFVDESFADACKAGDLLSFVESPFEFPSGVLQDIGSSVGNLGMSIAAREVAGRRYSAGKVNAALKHAMNTGSYYMASDLARLMMDANVNILEAITLKSLLIPELSLGYSALDASELEYQDCFFYRLELNSEVDAEKLPKFRECLIDELEGRVSAADLPKGRFDEGCQIEKFSSTAETTAEVLRLDIPLGARVCLTVLRKLYEQSGSGRRENALYRGLDGRAQRVVPKVLQILQTQGFVFRDTSRSNVIWRPARSHRDRVRRIIAAPTATDDLVLTQCGAISS